MSAPSREPRPAIRPQAPADGPAVRRVLELAFADEPEVAGLESAIAARADSRGFVAQALGEAEREGPRRSSSRAIRATT